MSQQALMLATSPSAPTLEADALVLGGHGGDERADLEPLVGERGGEDERAVLAAAPAHGDGDAWWRRWHAANLALVRGGRAGSGPDGVVTLTRVHRPAGPRTPLER